MNTLQQRELEEMEGMELNDETKERFKIEDTEQLNWAMRKIAALNNKKNGIDELVAKEMERLTSWREKECESINHSKTFFEGLIMEYAMNERAKDKDFKKASTPYGKVTFKKQLDKWEYQEDKLIESLKSAGMNDLIRIKEEPRKDELKKLAKVNYSGEVYTSEGERLEGVKVVSQPIKIIIEVQK